MQFAIGRNDTNPKLCIRRNQNNSWTAWQGITAEQATTATTATSLTSGNKTISGNLTLNGGNLIANKVNAVLTVSSTEENQNATIFLGTPFQNTGAYKCAIIAEAASAWSKSKLHFCLNNVDDNSRPAQNASLANSRVNIDYNGNMNISGRTYCNGGLNIQVNSWVYDTNGSQRIFLVVEDVHIIKDTDNIQQILITNGEITLEVVLCFYHIQELYY